MKILVLGGGSQGTVIARDLASALPDYSVAVADISKPTLPALPNLEWVETDLSDGEATARLLRQHDLGVGALPPKLGSLAMMSAIESRRNLVDVSYAGEDSLDMDAATRAAGITITPDCGLAPGLTNLIVGRMVAVHGTPDEILVLVGGVAADPSRPYGYVVTWSLDDLLEEYTRPARIIRGGLQAEVEPLGGLERVTIDGVGEMEAFYTDGLSTLLRTLPGVSEMAEKVLRWPGHAEAVRLLLAEGDLLEEFRRRCVANPPRDLVVLSIRMRWKDTRREATLVDRYDAKTRLTAMSRTTAFTASVVAQLAADGGLKEKGIQPLERVAQDEKAYQFIVDRMAERGVKLNGA